MSNSSSHDTYDRELAMTRRVLDTIPVAGQPRPDNGLADLVELRRLVSKYPDQARDLVLNGVQGTDSDRPLPPSGDAA